jgi:hypothetical protein
MGAISAKVHAATLVVVPVPTPKQTQPSKQTVQPTGSQSSSKTTQPTRPLSLPRTPVTVGVTATGKLVEQQTLQPHTVGVLSASKAKVSATSATPRSPAKTQLPVQHVAAQFNSWKPFDNKQALARKVVNPLRAAFSKGTTTPSQGTARQRSSTPSIASHFLLDFKVGPGKVQRSARAQPPYAQNLDSYVGKNANPKLKFGKDGVGMVGESGAAVAAISNATNVSLPKLVSDLNKANGFKGRLVKWETAGGTKKVLNMNELNRQLDGGGSVVLAFDSDNNKRTSRGGANGADTWRTVVGSTKRPDGTRSYAVINSDNGQKQEARVVNGKLQMVGNPNSRASGEMVMFKPKAGA